MTAMVEMIMVIMSTVPTNRTAAATQWRGVALQRELIGEEDSEYRAHQAHLLVRAERNAQEYGQIIDEARALT